MTFTKDDLITVCTTCKGAGKVTDPPQSQEHPGFGRRVTMQWETPCPVCKGTGKMLTEMGEAIAAVVRLLKEQGRQ